MQTTRRRFLASTTGGALGWSKLSAPSTFSSTDGVLDVSLEAIPTAGYIAGHAAGFWGFNGQLPGPILATQAGSVMRLHFRNGLAESTNLHFHGLHVKPTGNADNPFIEVPPGERFGYELQIPANHPAGMFWYHPHMHGSVARQMFKGLAGLIVVRGELDAIPEIAAAQEQFLVLQDFTLDRNGQIPEPTFFDKVRGREGAIPAVNGEATPTFWIQQNGLLRCRILNATCSRYYRLKIEDHPFAIVALDGGSLRSPLWVDEWLLVPGQRVDLLIAGDRPPGSYRILSLPYDRGAMGQMGLMGQLANRPTLVVGYLSYSGTAQRAIAVPERLLNVDALTAPSEQRRFVLTEGMMGSFQINGRAFQPNRTDTVVQLGAIEDWIVENRTPMDHPFHLHVNPFQLVDASGVASPQWLDVVNVPAAASRRIRVRFDDFPGRSLYHCHILDHEDLGMMGTLEILPAA